jgi:hypothetical protein
VLDEPALILGSEAGLGEFVGDGYCLEAPQKFRGRRSGSHCYYFSMKKLLALSVVLAFSVSAFAATHHHHFHHHHYHHHHNHAA